jgi:hypothetical protein
MTQHFPSRFVDRAVITGAIGKPRRSSRNTGPVDDLGLIDHETVDGLVEVGRCQAGRSADRAVDIGDGAAAAAHDVVVVVADAGLVAGHRTKGLYPAQQPHRGKGVEYVVDGLAGDLG